MPAGGGHWKGGAAAAHYIYLEKPSLLTRAQAGIKVLVLAVGKHCSVTPLARPWGAF